MTTISNLSKPFGTSDKQAGSKHLRIESRLIKSANRHSISAMKLAFGCMFLVASLLGPQSIAHAGDAENLKAVKTCLAAEKDGRACIGRVSTECLKKPEAETNEGHVACVSGEQTAWDAVLNDRYKSEVADAKKADADLKSQEGNWDSSIEALKKAQRAWVAYRDAECTRRYVLFQQGTYRFDAEAACQLDLTATRALDIATSQQ